MIISKDKIDEAKFKYSVDLQREGTCDKTDYFVSLGYHNLEGYTIESNFKRLISKIRG